MAEPEPKPNPEEELLRTIFGKPTSEAKPKTPEERAKLQEKIKEALERVFDSLTYREREIIKLRYGLGDGYTYTLEEVARTFVVTRERVRQIEAKAVRKLQHPSRARMLEGFLETPPQSATPSSPEGE